MSSDDVLSRADRLAAMGLGEEAAGLYEQAVRDGVPGAGVKYGAMLFDAGDIRAAERTLRAALAAGDSDAYDWLADVLLADDRATEAAELMERAAAQGSASAALRVAAIWSEAVDDRERAERWYAEAVRRGAPGALNDYGSFLTEDASRLAEAERVLREAAAQGDALAYSNLGGLELDRGDTEAAVTWLRQAVEADTSARSTALVKLALAEEQRGDLDTARAYLDRAVAAGTPDALVHRAQFLADHAGPQAREAAEADFRAAVENEDEGALYYYAEFLADGDRLDEAAEYYRRAIDDGSDAAYEDLALIEQERGNLEAAEDLLMESIDAGWLSAVFSYAQLLRETGRAAEIEALLPRAETLGASREQLQILRDLPHEDA
ncbi:tetratricopeptide repeat protein [Sphaerisporangium sp. TRM90804]|uniref:tetratricopeptide repeat protein n=1 Tax=Sphaerisporangium sp. TRM90804 TaxID=3031113 RepID=UPI00244D3DE2|nr:tetratricopeptide repeat protein [Sphaerisporangium sp. TRM90804]MDH2427927.1 tetratricopeptide repeat protein [Sphaerisporangium sp. TRM90804]